jgi:RimJ/RimL family protein N-acetyltransferase
LVAVRPVSAEDAAEMIELNDALDQETKFMLAEPGERITTLEQQAARFRALQDSPYEGMFVAEDDGRLAGYIVAAGSPMRRARSTARVVMGVRRNYWGRGVGAALMEAAESWARAKQIHRLELSVMVHNERAIALYERMGFEKEGVRRHALRIDGSFVDELYMGKLLSNCRPRRSGSDA